MRLRVRHLLLSLPAIAILLTVAVSDDRERHYCTSCGLIRLSDSRKLFGLSGGRSTGPSETKFHQLLLSTGQIECSHNWRAFFWNHHNVHRGEVHIPYVLTDYGWSGSQLDLLSKLEDPDKVATILTSIDLTDLFDERHLRDDGPAFEALEAVRHTFSEKEWWTKYQHLFTGRVPPNPALHRTAVVRDPSFETTRTAPYSRKPGHESPDTTSRTL
jgi:hypothetical protein